MCNSKARLSQQKYMNKLKIQNVLERKVHKRPYTTCGDLHVLNAINLKIQFLKRASLQFCLQIFLPVSLVVRQYTTLHQQQCT